ncbi:MAG: hypothetical protein V3W20_01665, partial [Candidatus Neomarinimicrobiota bacterium]
GKETMDRSSYKIVFDCTSDSKSKCVQNSKLSFEDIDVNLTNTCGCYLSSDIYSYDFAKQSELVQIPTDGAARSDKRHCYNTECIAANSAAATGRGMPVIPPFNSTKKAPLGCDGSSCVNIITATNIPPMIHSNITFENACELVSGAGNTKNGLHTCNVDGDCLGLADLSGGTSKYICGNLENDPDTQGYCYKLCSEQQAKNRDEIKDCTKIDCGGCIDTKTGKSSAGISLKCDYKHKSDPDDESDEGESVEKSKTCLVCGGNKESEDGSGLEEPKKLKNRAQQGDPSVPRAGIEQGEHYVYIPKYNCNSDSDCCGTGGVCSNGLCKDPKYVCELNNEGNPYCKITESDKSSTINGNQPSRWELCDRNCRFWFCPLTKTINGQLEPYQAIIPGQTEQLAINPASKNRVLTNSELLLWGQQLKKNNQLGQDGKVENTMSGVNLTTTSYDNKKLNPYGCGKSGNDTCSTVVLNTNKHVSIIDVPDPTRPNYSTEVDDDGNAENGIYDARARNICSWIKLQWNENGTPKEGYFPNVWLPNTLKYIKYTDARTGCLENGIKQIGIAENFYEPDAGMKNKILTIGAIVIGVLIVLAIVTYFSTMAGLGLLGKNVAAAALKFNRRR